MPSLRIYLFGVPRLEQEGENIPIHRRKAMALLAYLAVTGQPHSRDALATLLWPEYVQSSARANLRRDLSRLKRGLRNQALLVEQTHVGLNPQPELWLDVAEFRQRLAMVQQHSHAPDQLCADCLVALTEAATLYTDDFMAGFSLPDSPEFDEWHFFQAEGLRQYQECRRLLDEELGVEPEAETVALYEAIKTRQLELPAGEQGSRGAGEMLPTSHLPPERRYVVEELLVTGGHGQVYRGLDRGTGQPVVIKRLRPELMRREPEFVARFVREGEALRRLNHPNIVCMLATFEQAGQPHIVMEYVPGGSLRRLLDEQPRLPLERVLAIALELADALTRAHHLNILHRDIKPDNVLLAADGAPRLSDFGVARLEREESRLTPTGSLLGSPAYMSPEALRGEELDARSDIWSFGVLLYEMLAGRRPFNGEHMTAIWPPRWNGRNRRATEVLHWLPWPALPNFMRPQVRPTAPWIWPLSWPSIPLAGTKPGHRRRPSWSRSLTWRRSAGRQRRAVAGSGKCCRRRPITRWLFRKCNSSHGTSVTDATGRRLRCQCASMNASRSRVWHGESSAH